MSPLSRRNPLLGLGYNRHMQITWHERSFPLHREQIDGHTVHQSGDIARSYYCRRTLQCSDKHYECSSATTVTWSGSQQLHHHLHLLTFNIYMIQLMDSNLKSVLWFYYVYMIMINLRIYTCHNANVVNHEVQLCCKFWIWFILFF